MSWAPERQRLVRDGVCQRCGYENPSSSSWCGRCGAGWIDDEPRRPSRMGVAGPLNICPECGTVNGLDERVCRGCRLRLPGGRPAPERASQPPERASQPPERASQPPEPAPVPVPAAPLPSEVRPAVAAPARGRAVAKRLEAEWPRVATLAALVVAALAVLLTFLLSGGDHRRGVVSAAAHSAPAHPAGAHAARAKRSVALPKRSAVVAPVSRPPTPARRPTPPLGPLASVSAYWQSIERHAFAAAYALLAPGALGLSESQFVAEERGAGIGRTAFAGHLASTSGSTASVAVDTLVTHDQRYGCRSWSGSYVLADSGGRWRIARAALTPRGC